jgi:hemolysin III
MNLFDPREPVNTWTHGLWLLLALPGLLLLLRCGRGDLGKRICFLIYGLTLVFCSACSTLFHGVRLSREAIQTLDTLDHIGIYLLIAGTYTPIVWTFLHGRWRVGILSLVWSWAAAGIGLQLSFAALPGWLTTGFYLAMGWGAIFCYTEVARLTSHRALVPIVAGGALYSLGALFNLLHAPVLWPGVFQWHELFHVLVVAASALHFSFMLTVVDPWAEAPTPSMIPVHERPQRAWADAWPQPDQA